jgi:hypothetical protein
VRARHTGIEVNRLVVSRCVKLGLPVARPDVIDARRQFAARANLGPPHLRANTASVIASLDAWLAGH